MFNICYFIPYYIYTNGPEKNIKKIHFLFVFYFYLINLAPVLIN